jgi:predicted ATPase
MEAIAHLRQGLTLIKVQPPTQERIQQELDILMLLGSVYMAVTGYATTEVVETYELAWELCEQIEETPQTLSARLAVARLKSIQAKHEESVELAKQCLIIAQRQDDTELLAMAHDAVGRPLVLLGDLFTARSHLEQALALHQAQIRRTPTATTDRRVICLFELTWALMPLGYQDQALACVHQALDIAQELSHPFSLAFATNAVGIVHQLRREPKAAQEQVETSMQVNQGQGFPMLLGFNAVLWGWSLAMQGHSEKGLAQVQKGLATYRPTGHNIFYPWSLFCLAEAYQQSRQPEEALTVLVEALSVVNTTEERMWEAELHRLKGLCLLSLSLDDHTEAEICFHQAMTIAQNQSAKSWELRAATSLAKLWQSQGKRQDAYDLLAPVYNWFTEGFDTADLKDAKALLEELSESR